jgi:hypothetical protein
VVLERQGDAIRFNPTLLEFARHYRFEARPVAVACDTADPVLPCYVVLHGHPALRDLASLLCSRVITQSSVRILHGLRVGREAYRRPQDHRQAIQT